MVSAPGANLDDQEFEEYLDSVFEELQIKQDIVTSEYGLGSCARWQFDQETETLELFDEADRMILKADIIDIGSFASNSNTWKWAWANDSILPKLRKRSEPLKKLEEITGFPLFTQETAFSIDGEAMA